MRRIYYGALATGGDAPAGLMAMAGAYDNNDREAASRLISKSWRDESDKLLSMVPAHYANQSIVWELHGAMAIRI